MLHKVLPIAFLAGQALGHGYLTKPMSRTGLNAQVTTPSSPNPFVHD